MDTGGGFFGGFASGLQSGIQDARERQRLDMYAKQQQFNNELATRSEARAQDQFTHQRNVETLNALQDQITNLNRARLSATTPEARAELEQRATGLYSAMRDHQMAMYGPIFQDKQNQAQQVAHDLHSGVKTIQDVSPADLANSLHLSLQIDPQHLTDPNSPTVKAANEVTKIASTGGDPSQAIPHLSALYPSMTESHVGLPMYDGSTVTGSKIINAVPHPNDPNQTVLLGTFDVMHPDGRAGSFTQPFMADIGHTTLHPDDSQQHPVATIPTKDLVHNALAKATAIQAAQSPAVQEKLNGLSEQDKADQDFDARFARAIGYSQNLIPRTTTKVEGGNLVTMRTSDGAIISATPLTKNALDEARRDYLDAVKSGDPKRIAAAEGALNELTGDKVKIAEIAANARIEAAGMRGGLGDGAGAFGGKVGELSAALAEQGVSLPAGFRSKAQQIGLFNGLLARHPDKSPDEIANMIASGQIDFKNEAKMGQVAAGQAGKLDIASNELEALIPQIKEAAAAVPRGSFVPINKLRQMADSSLSDPNLIRLKALLNTAANNYDVIGGRGGTDVSKREHTRELFNSAMNNDALFAALDVMGQEARIGREAAQKAMHTRSGKGESGGLGQPASPEPVRVSSPEEAAKLPSGTLIQTPDGRIIRKH